MIGDDEAVEVMWYKVSDDEEEDEELFTEEDGSLVMDGVILADAGEYRCEGRRGEVVSRDFTDIEVIRKYTCIMYNSTTEAELLFSIYVDSI